MRPSFPYRAPFCQPSLLHHAAWLQPSLRRYEIFDQPSHLNHSEIHLPQKEQNFVVILLFLSSPELLPFLVLANLPILLPFLVVENLPALLTTSPLFLLANLLHFLLLNMPLLRMTSWPLLIPPNCFPHLKAE